MTGDAEPSQTTGTDATGLRPTGHARVDALLEGAAELERLPVAERPARFEQLHAALAAELDAEPGTVPVGLGPRNGREGAGPR